MTKTPEQKEIEEIKVSIVGIRKHLDDLKQKEIDSSANRIEINSKLDQIITSLTDNAFNSNSGYLSRLNKIEQRSLRHDMYWMFFGFVILSGGVIAGVIKWLIK
jgi:hypothetical protein